MLTTKPPTDSQAYVVVRAFFFDRAVRQPGERVSLAPTFAAEMLAAGKVRPAPADQPATDPAAESAPKPARKATKASA